MNEPTYLDGVEKGRREAKEEISALKADFNRWRRACGSGLVLARNIIINHEHYPCIGEYDCGAKFIEEIDKEIEKIERDT